MLAQLCLCVIFIVHVFKFKNNYFFLHCRGCTFQSFIVIVLIYLYFNCLAFLDDVHNLCRPLNSVSAMVMLDFTVPFFFFLYLFPELVNNCRIGIIC